MSLADKMETIKSEATALLQYANETTGEADTTLGDAVKRLADGYGGGGSGWELVTENHEEWALDSMFDPLSVTVTTSNQTIAASTLSVFNIPSIQLRDYDVAAVRLLHFDIKYKPGSSNFPRTLGSCYASAVFVRACKMLNSRYMGTSVGTSQSTTYRYQAADDNASSQTQMYGLYCSGPINATVRSNTVVALLANYNGYVNNVGNAAGHPDIILRSDNGARHMAHASWNDIDFGKSRLVSDLYVFKRLRQETGVGILGFVAESYQKFDSYPDAKTVTG